LNPDKFSLQRGFAVFQEHADYFMQILVKLIQGSGLGVGTGKTGHIPYVQTGFPAFLYDGGILFHGIAILFIIPVFLSLKPGRMRWFFKG
jgi:hypothetical protein